MNARNGEMFFGLASEDLRTTIHGLKAGKEIPIELRISNASVFKSGVAPFSARGIVRLGAIRLVDHNEAIKEAASIAKDADGEPIISYSYE